MSGRVARGILYVGVTLAALGLQLAAIFLNELFELRAQNAWGTYGSAVFYPALGSVLASLASGFLLALLLVTWPRPSTSRGRVLLKLVLLTALPLLAILHHLFWSASGSYALVPPINDFWINWWQWAMDSQVPSFWVGLALGWASKQFVGREYAPEE